MPGGGGVHLFLQHALIDRADGVLRAAEHLRARALGLAEREFGDRVADAALDPLRAQRNLVVALALAPFLRPVCVADGHADDRDRSMDTSHRNHPRNPPPGPDDDLAADLLAKDAVRRADVAGSFRCDRRRFQAETCLADRLRGLEDDLILRCAPGFEREIEAREVERDSR